MEEGLLLSVLGILGDHDATQRENVSHLEMTCARVREKNFSRTKVALSHRR